MSNVPRLAFIGFGEAGQAFAQGFGAAGLGEIAAFDLRGSEPALRDAAEALKVRLAPTPAEAIAGADFVFSAVTASSSLDAARSVAALLRPGQIFVDINSVSPGRKRQAAAIIGEAIYVDLAVMAPVHPGLQATPCLAAGAPADRFIEALQPFGMRLDRAGPAAGSATVVKMCRSVMVKGLEALTYECFATARAAGVEPAILASLAKSWPGIDWPALGAYNLNRMLQHGVRRAAEMREVAATVEELGVEAHLARATVEHQERLGRLPLVLQPGDLGEMLDRIRACGDEPSPADASDDKGPRA
jgi:3-hydroxyisobutyrate dehydrogenase-like beta-hydroxyacid dehydrogenase